MIHPGDDNPLRLVAVLRVSTGQQAGSGLGLEAQRSAIERYVAYTGHHVVEWITEAASGKTTDREGLRRAREMVEDRWAGGIIVAKLDRLARSMSGLLEFVEWAKTHDASFVIVQEQIDTTTAMGMMMAQVMMAVAELERRMIGERTAAALRAKRARGEHLGAVPLGMLREGKRVVRDPAWALCRENAEHWRAAGFSFEMTAVNMDECRPDGRAWTKGSIRRLLRVPVGLG